MARHGDTEIDRALEVVVSEINNLAERQDGGPGVVLTVGGLIIGGTIIPDWQWFDDVEHVARAAFTVHTGGSIDDEHGLGEAITRRQRVAGTGPGGAPCCAECDSGSVRELPPPARSGGPHHPQFI